MGENSFGTGYFLFLLPAGRRHAAHTSFTEIWRAEGNRGNYGAASGGFFEGIDMLVPVPLHKKKEKLRGYNQSEWIARGVSVITLIPVFTSGMVREKNTETQTHKSAFERWENVDGIFRVTIPEYFSGKHILIIDDVLTTGATIVACASAFDKVEDIRISILTLAVAE